MSLAAICVRCVWCEDRQVYDGIDPEQAAREAGWFQLVDYEDEEPMDFCSAECLKSWLL
jgi:hypothetical protein